MSRVIYRSKAESSYEVLSLLRTVFLAELIQPSRTIWLVSPWISDVALIENAGDQFTVLGDWSSRSLRLSAVLEALMLRGTAVVVATTDSPSNQAFLKNMRLMATRGGFDPLYIEVIDEEDRLHEKALTGDGYLLTGSMNLTNNGIRLNSERVEFTTTASLVNEARLANHERFGGQL